MSDPEAQKLAEAQIVRALLPYRDRLPADAVVIALLRCARVLLRKLPPDQQKALLPACRAYIEGKASPPLESESLILLN